MHVVDDQHQRPRAGDADQKAGHRVVEAEARLVAPQRLRFRHGGDEVADLRQEPRDLGPVATQLPGETDGVGLAHVGADRLREGPVGRGGVGLMAGRGEDERAAHARVGDQLLGEPRLADPRLALDQRGAAAARRARAHRTSRSSSNSASRPTKRPAARASSGFLRRILLRGGSGSGSIACSRIRTSRADAGRSSGDLASSASTSCVQLGADELVVSRGRHGLGAEMAADDADGIVARERRLAAQHLVQQRPERVEVGALVGAPTDRLLRRQVGGGADHHPLDRLARAHAHRRGRSRRSGRGPRSRARRWRASGHGG